MRKFLLMLMVMSLAVFTLFGCTPAEEPETEDPVVEDEEVVEKDIVDIASSNEDLSTLVAALQKAELVDTLKGDRKSTRLNSSHL